MKKYLTLIGLAGLIICIDQATKLYIHTHFMHGEMSVILDNFFRLTYVRNTGAAFGFMRDAPEMVRSTFFLMMPPVACLIILFLIRSTPKKDTAVILALSSIFGGALGNYIDRLRHGFVVDFLDFHYYEKASWPAFNVADIAIVVGISVMILLELQKMQAEAKLKKKNI
jgi:signal peptidase II